MQRSQVFPYYRKCCKWLDEIYEFLQTQFDDNYTEELCSYRGYVSDEQYNLIRDMRLGCCDVLEDDLGEHAREVGVVNDKGNFILSNRYIIPVYDVIGNLSALIGYYPDKKRYITTPSPYFSKEVQFFNFKQAYELSMSEYQGVVFLVEGIFDCLSMRSIGLPCMATMGASVSKDKGELLKLFRKVIGIPDNDQTGRRSLIRHTKYGWKVPANTTMLKVISDGIEINGETYIVKDMDNFVSWYDIEDVRETLLRFKDSNEEVEELII